MRSSTIHLGALAWCLSLAFFQAACTGADFGAKAGRARGGQELDSKVDELGKRGRAGVDGNDGSTGGGDAGKGDGTGTGTGGGDGGGTTDGADDGDAPRPDDGATDDEPLLEEEAQEEEGCSEEAPNESAETLQTELDRPRASGDMNRKSLDGHADKHRLQDVVNKQCLANHDPTVSSVSWTNPVISADKATRDAVCKLHGFRRATEAFGFYRLRSPKNDHAAAWDAAQGVMAVNLDAARSPTENTILVWTECAGKMTEACAAKAQKEFRCKP